MDDRDKTKKRMAISLLDSQYLDDIGLDYNRKYHLQLLLASLRYFQEICEDNALSIHEVTREYIVEREKEYHDKAKGKKMVPALDKGENKDA